MENRKSIIVDITVLLEINGYYWIRHLWLDIHGTIIIRPEFHHGWLVAIMGGYSELDLPPRPRLFHQDLLDSSWREGLTTCR